MSSLTRKAVQPASFSKYAAGVAVAVEDAFTGKIHTGTVTRVNVLKNGYPETFVSFPTKYKGERAWAISTLRTPEELTALIAERNQLFPQNRLQNT